MIHHGRKITARVEPSILVSDKVCYCPSQNWVLNRFAKSCLECCVFDADEATEEFMTAAEARWIDGMLPEARIYIRNSKREEGLQGFYIEMHETALGFCLEVMIDRCFEDGKDCSVQFTTIIVRDISRSRDLS